VLKAVDKLMFRNAPTQLAFIIKNGGLVTVISTIGGFLGYLTNIILTKELDANSLVNALGFLAIVAMLTSPLSAYQTFVTRGLADNSIQKIKLGHIVFVIGAVYFGFELLLANSSLAKSSLLRDGSGLKSWHLSLNIAFSISLVVAFSIFQGKQHFIKYALLSFSVVLSNLVMVFLFSKYSGLTAAIVAEISILSKVIAFVSMIAYRRVLVEVLDLHDWKMLLVQGLSRHGRSVFLVCFSFSIFSAALQADVYIVGEIFPIDVASEFLVAVVLAKAVVYLPGSIASVSIALVASADRYSLAT